MFAVFSEELDQTPNKSAEQREAESSQPCQPSMTPAYWIAANI